MKNGLYLSQEQLIKQMDYAGREADGIAIWYLGQEGFMFKRNGLTILVDPYLTDSVDRIADCPPELWQRRYPAPLDPRLLKEVDLVLCTHVHMDHLDPESIAAIAQASPHCKFAAPASCRNALILAGVSEELTLSMKAGQTLSWTTESGGQFIIHPIAAAHESYELDDGGTDIYLGYVFEWDGICLYHAGDTLVTEQLIDDLKAFRIDVGFVPINGRDIFRNRLDVVGNMNAQEAVKLAVELEFDVIVPMHYDLYLTNGGSPASMIDDLFHHHPGRKIKLFQPGERWVYNKLDRDRPTAVIVGAGTVGRGFVARLLSHSTYRIVFIDHSIELIQKINADQSYAIHDSHQKQRPVYIHGVSAYLLGTEEAIVEISQAEVIFTAVGIENLHELAEPLHQANVLRRHNNAKSPLKIITCENGGHPGMVLRTALEFSGLTEIVISEHSILCSTMELSGTRLDIIAEAYQEQAIYIQK